MKKLVQYLRICLFYFPYFGRLSEFIRFRKSVTAQKLFSCKFYTQACPKLKKRQFTLPIWHYFEFGWKKGKNPCGRFDTKYYLNRYPDVAASKINPLWHYVQLGKKENRFISSSDEQLSTIANSKYFDSNYYLNQINDLNHMSPVQHFHEVGWKKGLNPSSSFNTQYYLTRYRDVAKTGANPLVHFLLHGRKEQRFPNEDDENIALVEKSELWDAQYYLTTYEDIRDANVNPLHHYYRFGWKAGRNPSSKFSTRYYLNQNPDVKQTGQCPLVHYIRSGKKEGRLCSWIEDDIHKLQNGGIFDESYYLKNNPDVPESGLTAAEHFYFHGHKEGRAPCPNFNYVFYSAK